MPHIGYEQNVFMTECLSEHLPIKLFSFFTEDNQGTRQVPKIVRPRVTMISAWQIHSFPGTARRRRGVEDLRHILALGTSPLGQHRC